ncbi:MAG: ATP-binding cassette domain-containing protein, partial [Proteobacteria bacterium]|nr:ATP-binding cassette domain-containing protein [Pseudomonadota bacterium]
LIDQGFIFSSSPDQLQSFLIHLGLSVILLALASYGRSYFVSWLGERVITDLRQDLFKHLLHLDIGYFEQHKSGTLVSSLTTDTTLIQVLVGTSVAIALRNILLLIGGFIMMLIVSWKLSFIACGIVPIVLVPIILYGRRVRQLSQETQASIADVGGIIEETLNNLRLCQAFTHEKYDQLAFNDTSEKAFRISVRRIHARSIMAAMVILLVFSGVSVILYQGGQDVLLNHMTPGSLSAFLFYAIVVASSTGSLSEIINDLQRAAGACERIINIFKTQPTVKEALLPKSLPYPSRGILAIHNINFAYPSRQNFFTLKEFTLSIAPGEKVARVGPSGAGKSTVFSLILRFYDPQVGTIHFDGVNIQEVSLQDLRRRIAFVPQEPILFSTSIYENIRFGNPSASGEAIWQACEAAYLTDFIQSLPKGIHTSIGVKGVKLSGGQKQRIAIARALLRDPSLLLLDEATSALDSQSEEYVQKSLKSLMKNRTTLVIAHRLATVLQSDRIVVLNQGRIEAVGTHAELISEDGLYRRLATLQFHDGLVLGEKKFKRAIA